MELKKKYLSLLCLAAFVQPVHAAELTGRIWFEKTKRAASHISVSVQCSDKINRTSVSDAYGFYRVTGILKNNRECYIFISDKHHHSDPLSYASGEGSDTLNFGIIRSGSKFLVRRY